MGSNIKNCLAYSQMKDHDSDLYGYAPAYDGEGTEELIYSLDVYKSYYVLEHGAGEKDFADYCAKLVSCGFELYSSNAANGNSFATYTDGENIVNVSYIRYRDIDRYIMKDVSYVAIAVDSAKNCALPEKCGDYEEVTTVQFSMIDGFIIRLKDGRFLVIDSALERERPIELIYAELCRQNVLPGKPVVAAWMFSHAHSDHVGAFIGILKKYGDMIDVQTVIHGFPGEETYVGKNYMEYHMYDESTNMTNRSVAIYNLMKEKMPNGKFVTAHAGQIFEYPGVKLEVLFTSENLYGQQMFDSNMSSVIYALTMPTGKLLALGDAVDAEAKIFRKIYGKDIKCDAVILAHHAFNGGDEELYYNVGAKVAIWPNTLERLTGDKLIGNYTNHFDFNSVKYNLIMSVEDDVMTLFDGVSEEYLAIYDRKFDIKPWDAVDYDARKTPKNYLTFDRLAEGYGNAPRYYGKGEENEEIVIDPANKTYTVLIKGAAAYNYEYYGNSLKRDGYKRGESGEEDGKKFVRYTGANNSVDLVFAPETDGAASYFRITVGAAGKDTL